MEKKSRIPGLDALRCVAVSMVVVYHFSHHLHWTALMGDMGPMGVMIFFVLSGYLITSLLMREYGRGGDISLKRFYRNRALRLFPVFYLCWTANTAYFFIFHRGMLKEPDVLASAFYMANYAWGLLPNPNAYHNFGIAWSLAIEEQFYLLWPVALLFMLRRGWNLRRCLFATIAVIWAWRTIALTAGIATPNYVYNAFETRIDSLLIGCALAFFPQFRASWRLGTVSAISLLGILFAYQKIGPNPAMLAAMYIAEPVLIAVGMSFLMQCRVGFFSSRPVALLAALSYSIYLTHGWFMLAPKIPFIILVPLALRYAVELPMARWRRSLEGRNHHVASEHNYLANTVQLDPLQ